jgi:hypothetical protein
MILNELYVEVHVNLNVFVMKMLSWIFGEIVGTLIVTPEGG